MPQRDVYHDAVKQALIKDGWTITHDPYTLVFGTRRVYVDLGLTPPLAASKEGRELLVEIKSFLSPSPLTDLERTLGQYILYRIP
ncbi:MAG: XisH family protein [Chloroflexaceae bacterium]|jgi:hypothetical protein|nr:XisH family protein [Chloroflexaceae bacterium]